MGFTPPTTWEELAEQSKAIYEKYGIPGFAADSLTDLMHMLIMQSGNVYIDMENKCVLLTPIPPASGSSGLPTTCRRATLPASHRRLLV